MNERLRKRIMWKWNIVTIINLQRPCNLDTGKWLTWILFVHDANLGKIDVYFLNTIWT